MELRERIVQIHVLGGRQLARHESEALTDSHIESVLFAECWNSWHRLVAGADPHFSRCSLANDIAFPNTRKWVEGDRPAADKPQPLPAASQGYVMNFRPSEHGYPQFVGGEQFNHPRLRSVRMLPAPW